MWLGIPLTFHCKSARDEAPCLWRAHRAFASCFIAHLRKLSFQECALGLLEDPRRPALLVTSTAITGRELPDRPRRAIEPATRATRHGVNRKGKGEAGLGTPPLKEPRRANAHGPIMTSVKLQALTKSTPWSQIQKNQEPRALREARFHL